MLKRTTLLLLILLICAPLPLAAQEPQRLRVTTASQNGSPANAPRTLPELQNRIQQITNQPALAPGFFAVKIVSLDTGMVIFEQDANKFVRPASNMKLYTVAAAFDRLTPDYRFITSVYAKERLTMERSRAT